MLTIRLRVTDVTAGRPLTGARVQVAPLAVPRWADRAPGVDTDDGRRGPVLGAPDGPGPGAGGIMIADVDGAPGPPPKTATVDLSGHLQLTFGMASSFAEAAQRTRDGAVAADVVVAVRYRVDHANISRRALVPIPLLSRTSPRLVLDPDAAVDSDIVVDLGLVLVGATTSTTATLLLAATGPLRSGAARVLAHVGDGTAVRSAPFEVVDADEDIGVARLRNLAPGSHHSFDVIIDHGDESTVLASGGFGTEDPAGHDLRVGFLSCNHLLGTERWRRLAATGDLDLVLMTGDQIYEYGLHGSDRDSWRDAYINRYRYTWQSPEVRAVLRQNSSFMILDDHDVKDDLGIVDVPGPRRRAALEAYRLFQQQHGPRGNDTGRAHYSFRRGPAAFFVLDLRAQRVEPPPEALAESEEAHLAWTNRPSSTVLGAQQIADLQAWAMSEDALTADIAVIVASVPPAYVPIPVLLEMLSEVEDAAGDAGRGIGGSIGQAAGGLLGPFGAYVGREVGEALGEKLGTEIADYLIDREQPLTAFDIADSWTWQPNQPDLVRVLDVAFDLAADVNHPQGGAPRPRAVFILSGDVHAGAVHVLRSKDPRHLRNSSILQLTSSAIANDPPPEELWDLVQHLQPGTAWPAVVADMALGTGLGNERARFLLDSELGGRFEAVCVDFLPEPNFGTLTVRGATGGSRRYEVHTEIAGRSRVSHQSFGYDLDAGVVEPENLLGDVVQAEGEIAMFRTHRRGSGFGSGADELDDEAVLQMVGWPGWTFGLALQREQGVSSAEEMATLCRDAVLGGRPVRIDFTRTGPSSGTVLRVESR